VNKLEADKADAERRLREAEEEGEARIQAVKAQVQTQTGQATRYVGLSLAHHALWKLPTLAGEEIGSCCGRQREGGTGPRRKGNKLRTRCATSFVYRGAYLGSLRKVRTG
jgi:hypothetical protein